MCALISSICGQRQPSSHLPPEDYLKIIMSSLQRSEISVQEAAAAALASLTNRVPLPRPALDQLCQQAQSNTQDFVTRRGSALGLGFIALESLSTREEWLLVLETLLSACSLPSEKSLVDAEARRFAIRGLSTFLHNSERKLADYLDVSLSERVLAVLLTALDDYTTDARGDVGSWVREEAMQVLSLLLPLMDRVCRLDQEQVLRLCQRVIGKLLRQGVEKIDRVRAAAGLALTQLVHGDSCVMQVMPAIDTLRSTIPK